MSSPDFGAHPDLSWSRSRHETFRVCRRRYYYRYYASWKGWEEEAPAESRRAYLLKQLTTLQAELGKSLHRRAFEVGFRASQGLEPPSLETLLQRTRDELNEVVLASRDRRSFVRRPAGTPFLRSVWYGGGLPEEEVEEVKARLEPVHRRLREHELWGEVGAAGTETVRHLSDPDVVPEDRLRFQGVPVYAEPDLVLEDGEGGWTVVDWKSGRERQGDVLQVAVYGLFVRERWGAERIRGRVEYLDEGTSRVVELGEEELSRAREMGAESLDEMRSLLADPEENRPRGKEAFPLTENRSVCRWCDFFELCEPEFEGSPPGPGSRG